jgi:peptidoglycan hydrolase CwlO-like protein
MKKTEPKENLKKILKEQGEETRRYLGALSEDFHSQVEAIAEQYGDINKKLDGHTEMIGSMKVDLEIIKTDVEFIKNSLKIKVDLEEFSALERRVALLEKRLRLSAA